MSVILFVNSLWSTIITANSYICLIFLVIAIFPDLVYVCDVSSNVTEFSDVFDGLMPFSWKVKPKCIIWWNLSLLTTKLVNFCFFQGLTPNWLIANNHSVGLWSRPDPDYHPCENTFMLHVCCSVQHSSSRSKYLCIQLVLLLTYS
jgi:hypothetical protein